MSASRLEELRQIVASINEATTAAQLDALWLDLMGLESVDYEDEAGAQTIDEARDILRDWVREECHADGIHCADVGLMASA